MRMTWPKKLLLGAVGILLLAVPIVAGAVWAQTGQTEDTSAPESKNLKFAVVSIRQSKSGGSQNWGEATPDGYEMRNMFLMAPILTAYPPTGGASAYDRVIGGADWLGNDWNYNIDAKVDPADLADWQNPKKQPAMLRAMLQAMLADRMKLKVHRITKEGPVYALVVGGKGSRLKETDPNDPHPGAYPMPGGGKTSHGSKRWMDDGALLRHLDCSAHKLWCTAATWSPDRRQNRSYRQVRYDDREAGATAWRERPRLSPAPGNVGCGHRESTRIEAGEGARIGGNAGHRSHRKALRKLAARVALSGRESRDHHRIPVDPNSLIAGKA